MYIDHNKELQKIKDIKEKNYSQNKTLLGKINFV